MKKEITNWEKRFDERFRTLYLFDHSSKSIDAYTSCTEEIKDFIRTEIASAACEGTECIECGCTDHFACEGGCSWVPLCTSCFSGFVRKEKVIKLLKNTRLKKPFEAKGEMINGTEIKFLITNSQKIMKIIFLKLCEEIKNLH